MAFFLGGVGMAEMVISTLMLVVTAVFFCTLGLFFSSFAKRTLIATVSSYGTVLLSFIVLILLLFFISAFESSNIFQSAVTDDILNIMIWFLFSTNPFFAAAVSEVILIDNQSLFITTSGVLGSSSIPLLSPWIIYITFYVFVTILLIGLSIYFVNRPDR